MVDVRARGGEQLGKFRINDFLAKIKAEVPPKARKEQEFIDGIWREEDFPFDQALYNELMEQDKKRKEEEIVRAKDDKEKHAAKQEEVKKREAEKAAARKAEKEANKKLFEEK
jgi:hypothetical protein